VSAISLIPFLTCVNPRLVREIPKNSFKILNSSADSRKSSFLDYVSVARVILFTMFVFSAVARAIYFMFLLFCLFSDVTRAYFLAVARSLLFTF
jgi:hypothetical protein